MSGTSGGALCATLVWYAVRRGKQPPRPSNVETLMAHSKERGRAFLAEHARRVGQAGA